MIVLFWISILILTYHIFLYGVLLKLLSSFKKKTVLPEIVDYPSITVLCPAYNEEQEIENKIKSFLELDYPKDKIKMIVISDQSTDKTDEIVQKYTDNPQIKLVVQIPRKGKQSGHNLIEPMIDTEYVLSTDANSIFAPSAVKELVKVMFSDPHIGMVSGELRLKKLDGKDSGEGIYWKYESWLKRMDSDFYSIIGANGSIFLVKRSFFTQIDAASVDDFERTLIVLKNKYVAKYNPGAVVYEYGSSQATEEIGRKTRIITQEWFALKRNAILLNPFLFGRISFILISHKLIRWLLPIFSLGILIPSIFLWGNWFYYLALIAQLVIYVCGSIEIMLQKKKHSIKPFKFFAYWVAMNLAAARGLIDFFRGKKYAIWNTIRT